MRVREQQRQVHRCAVEFLRQRETKRANAGAAKDDEDDEWRHPPIAPVDEGNPLKSLGRAIADVATSSSGPAPKPRDR